MVSICVRISRNQLTILEKFIKLRDQSLIDRKSMQALSFHSALNHPLLLFVLASWGGGCCSWTTTIPLKAPFSRGVHRLAAPRGAESSTEVRSISIARLQGKARNNLTGTSRGSGDLCTKVQRSFCAGDSRTTKRRPCPSLINHSLKKLQNVIKRD